MNSENPGLPPTSLSSVPGSSMDLQALLATIPDFGLMPSLPPMPPKPTTSMPDLASQIFPTSLANDPQLTMAALSMSMMSMPSFPFINMPQVSSSLATMGLAAQPCASNALSGSLPPHATLESLGLMNNSLMMRPSSSAMSSPVQQQLSAPSRPRAYSSAATLQHPKNSTTPDRRRKRTRKTDDDPVPSLLRMLVDEDEVVPVKSTSLSSIPREEEKNRMDAAKILTKLAISDEPMPKVRVSPDRTIDVVTEEEFAHIPLRRIIRDQDLPESVGPDSPFRHHPKYQRRAKISNAALIGDMEAITAYCVVNGFVPADGKSARDADEPMQIERASPKSNDFRHGSVSPQFTDVLDYAICRELVTAE